jgi:hypothetical protein
MFHPYRLVPVVTILVSFLAAGENSLRAFGLLLRFYSYLFHLAASFFFLALGFVSAVSSSPLHLDAIGLPPEKALLGVFALGLVGLVSTLLALTGTFRLLFPAWAAVVLWLMIKGFFLSPMAFSGPADFRWAILLTLAAVGAFFGALWTLKPRSRL